MAGNKVLEYIISAKDKTEKGVKAATARIKDFAAKVGANLANIKAGFDMLKNAVASFWGFLQKSLRFEVLTNQFQTLIGNIEETKRHMQDLKEFGDTPPFSTELFAQASRDMMVMTQGVLGFKESLVLVGDAAAATGNELPQVAHVVGQLYQSLADGRPIEQTVGQLKNMGLVTPALAAELSDLAQSGENATVVWNKVTEALKKHEGAMANTETTAQGLFDALDAQKDNVIRAFGDELMNVAKGPMKTFLEWLKKIQEDGTIEVWADRAAKALQKAIDGFGMLVGACKTVYGWFEKVFTFLGASLYSVETLFKDIFSGNFSDSLSDAKKAFNDFYQAVDNEAKAQIEREEKLREEAAKKAADAKVKEEKRAAEEQRKIQEKLIEQEKKAREEANKRGDAKMDELFGADGAAQQMVKALVDQRKEEENAALKAQHEGFRDFHAGQAQQARAAINQMNGQIAQEQAALAQAQNDRVTARHLYRNRDEMRNLMREERLDALADKKIEADAKVIAARQTANDRTMTRGADGRLSTLAKNAAQGWMRVRGADGKLHELSKEQQSLDLEGWKNLKGLSARQEAVRRAMVAKLEEEQRQKNLDKLFGDVNAMQINLDTQVTLMQTQIDILANLDKFRA